MSENMASAILGVMIGLLIFTAFAFGRVVVLLEKILAATGA